MSRVLLTIIIVLALACTPQISAQPREEAFKSLETRLDAQARIWNLDNRKLAAAFNQDRIRLGQGFEKPLMRYLGTDVDKHYWISCYLTDEYYLHGNTPEPYLALVIKEQGIRLCRLQDTRDARAEEVGFCVTAAVLSQKLGLEHSAREHKTRAELLMKGPPALAAAFPAMDEDEQKLYEAIEVLPSAPSKPKE